MHQVILIFIDSRVMSKERELIGFCPKEGTHMCLDVVVIEDHGRSTDLW
jgi:hypothetical protein